MRPSEGGSSLKKSSQRERMERESTTGRPSGQEREAGDSSSPQRPGRQKLEKKFDSGRDFTLEMSKRIEDGQKGEEEDDQGRDKYMDRDRDREDRK